MTEQDNTINTLSHDARYRYDTMYHRTLRVGSGSWVFRRSPLGRGELLVVRRSKILWTPPGRLSYSFAGPGMPPGLRGRTCRGEWGGLY